VYWDDSLDGDAAAHRGLLDRLPTKAAYMKKLPVLVIVSLVAAASAQAAGAGVRKHGLQLAQKKAAGRQSSF